MSFVHARKEGLVMLVLDANIPIRAALGSRAPSLLRKYADQVDFLAPDAAFEEAGACLAEVPYRSAAPSTGLNAGSSI